jgi:D-arabinose 1-dehydrogenase-like Zn-dependent alcohol dehydrogenase
LCPQQTVIGVDRYGGAAERIGVDGRFAFKLPSTLESVTSAPLLSSGLTVYSAIVRADLADCSAVAVLGIGGLGHLALQFLRKMGHRVSAFSHSPEKRGTIEQLGAAYIDSSQLDDSGALTRRFDFILSTLNTQFDVNRYLRMLRPQGKLCFVAQPLEPIPVSAGALYDNARRTIYGSYVGSRKDMVSMLTFAAEHDIRSAVHVMPFTEVNDAIDMVRKGSGSIRVVLQR